MLHKYCRAAVAQSAKWSTMARPSLPELLLLLLMQAGTAAASVTLSVWNNSAWAGEPQSSETVPALSFSRIIPTGTSVEMTGTLTLPLGSTEYNFSCAFANTTSAFLWIDDHLVCQDGNIYTAVPVARTDLPLKRLSKAALPVVLRLYTAPPQLPRGPVSYIGSWKDAPARVMRFGPQSYGFTPQGCADACATYEYCGLQDVGGRFARKACPGAKPGTCSNQTGYCSCDNDLSHIESLGKPTEPRCNHAVQTCSYVNSVYRSAPAPPSAPFGSESRLVSAHVTWQQLSAPPGYGSVGAPLTPLLSFDDASAVQMAGVAAAAPTLSATLPLVEVQRRKMQSELATGWASWVFDDLVALASLPSGVTIRPVICVKANLTNCLDSLIVNAGGEGGATNVRSGSHAYDRSYAEIESLEFEGLHLQLRWGYVRGELRWAATPLSSGSAKGEDFVIKLCAHTPPLGTSQGLAISD